MSRSGRITRSRNNEAASTRTLSIARVSVQMEIEGRPEDLLAGEAVAVDGSKNQLLVFSSQAIAPGTGVRITLGRDAPFDCIVLSCESPAPARVLSPRGGLYRVTIENRIIPPAAPESGGK